MFKRFLNVSRLIVMGGIGYFLLKTVLPVFGVIAAEEVIWSGALVFALSASFLLSLIKTAIQIFLFLAIVVVVYWLYTSGYLERISPQFLQMLQTILRAIPGYLQ